MAKILAGPVSRICMGGMRNRGKVYAAALPHFGGLSEGKRKPRAFALGFDRTLLRLIGVRGFPH
ncbi:conserved hypothetical protein [Vibrio diabolicus]|nr:conserved hypothetical protein [Vibrio diabolicus]